MALVTVTSAAPPDVRSTAPDDVTAKEVPVSPTAPEEVTATEVPVTVTAPDDVNARSPAVERAKLVPVCVIVAAAAVNVTAPLAWSVVVDVSPVMTAPLPSISRSETDALPVMLSCVPVEARAMMFVAPDTPSIELVICTPLMSTYMLVAGVDTMIEPLVLETAEEAARKVMGDVEVLAYVVPVVPVSVCATNVNVPPVTVKPLVTLTLPNVAAPVTASALEIATPVDEERLSRFVAPDTPSELDFICTPLMSTYWLVAGVDTMMEPLVLETAEEAARKVMGEVEVLAYVVPVVPVSVCATNVNVPPVTVKPLVTLTLPNVAAPATESELPSVAAPDTVSAEMEAPPESVARPETVAALLSEVTPVTESELSNVEAPVTESELLSVAAPATERVPPSAEAPATVRFPPMVVEPRRL